MFDSAQILTAFQNLNGWLQNEDAGGVQLIESNQVDLTSSTSGLYFNDEHPMLDFNNLISICPDFEVLTTDDTGRNQAFSDWLKKKTDAAIIRALTDWYNKKLKNKTGNSIVEKNNSLVDGIGTPSNMDVNNGNRVFYEFKVKESDSLLVKGLQVGFQFSGSENFTARLYEQGKQDAIATINIDYTTALNLQWFDIPNFTLQGGKTYYWSYDQSDINSQSLNGLIESDYYAAGQYKYPASKFFYVKAGHTTESGVNLWDVSKNRYDELTNHGMNLKYKVYCDYTNFFIENKNDFTQLISIYVAISMIHRITFNSQARSNRYNNNIDISIMLREIDGEAKGRASGLMHRYKEAMHALQFDLSTIDPVCLKCKKKARIKMRVG